MNPTETHRLDRLLGPSGSFGGWIILLTGLVAVFASLTALFLVIIGAFAALTTTISVIDTGRRRVKYATALFGFIRIGRWITITDDMKLRVRQSGRRYTAYSRGNRPLDMSISDFSIVLKASDGKEICPLQRFRNRQDAENQIVKLARRLNVEIVT
jgi:hypothetical protein